MINMLYCCYIVVNCNIMIMIIIISIKHCRGTRLPCGAEAGPAERLRAVSGALRASTQLH